MSKLHEQAEMYLEEGRAIADNGPESTISKALLLYRLSGQAQGYGMAMLSYCTHIEWRHSRDLFSAADKLFLMAESVLATANHTMRKLSSHE